MVIYQLYYRRGVAHHKQLCTKANDLGRRTGTLESSIFKAVSEKVQKQGMYVRACEFDLDVTVTWRPVTHVRTYENCRPVDCRPASSNRELSKNFAASRRLLNVCFLLSRYLFK